MIKTVFISFIILFVFVSAACANMQDAVAEPVEQTTLEFEDAEMLLNVGDIVALSLTQGGAEHKLVFESSNESVAIVTPDGTITAIAAGNAVITSHMDGAVAYLKITVIAPKTISIVLERYIFNRGETVDFDVTVLPEGESYDVSITYPEASGGMTKPVLNNSLILDATGLYVIQAVSGDVSASTQFVVFGMEEFTNEVFELTNNEREALGLDPLEHDEDLDKAAAIRVLEIAEHFSHTRPDGSSFATAFFEAEVTSGRWGENLASGQNIPSEVIQSWLDSESHREAMLNPEYLYMGVGIFIDPEGKTFWVQAFRG